MMLRQRFTCWIVRVHRAQCLRVGNIDLVNGHRQIRARCTRTIQQVNRWRSIMRPLRERDTFLPRVVRQARCQGHRTHL